MHCTRVKLANGMIGIVCGSRQSSPTFCVTCDQLEEYLCDWKIGDGKTCDRPICGAHAQEVAPDKHLCPKHQKMYQEWLAAHGKVLTDTGPLL